MCVCVFENSSVPHFLNLFFFCEGFIPLFFEVGELGFVGIFS